jgi:hypothetical protein
MSPHAIILQMKRMLTNLDAWLVKADALAAAKKFEPTVLLESRLAPDMFPLMRQIQTACDHAKFAAARTTAKDPPAHPDTEKTMAEAHARIATVIKYLDGFSAKDFEGIETRKIALPRWEGRSMTAPDYLLQHALPNFFFHVTTAYAILRHNGLDVGKKDYLGAIDQR